MKTPGNLNLAENTNNIGINKEMPLCKNVLAVSKLKTLIDGDERPNRGGDPIFFLSLRSWGEGCSGYFGEEQPFLPQLV